MLGKLAARVRGKLAYEAGRWRESRNLRGRGRQCYICRATFGRFLPFRDGERSPFTLLLRCVGSDVENFYCPACGCFDRERHLFMYFDALKLWDAARGGRVLHVAPAPEAQFAGRLAAAEPTEYVKGDLSPTDGMVRLDVTALDFPDEHFDLAVCNHVLEHVRDDERAMAELFRVLKPGGRLVCQTPFSTVLANSFQDPNVDTDEKRRFYYGQEDHVRVFGQDLFAKLKRAGFIVEARRHDELFPAESAAYYGVNPVEDMIIVTKP